MKKLLASMSFLKNISVRYKRSHMPLQDQRYNYLIDLIFYVWSKREECISFKCADDYYNATDFLSIKINGGKQEIILYITVAYETCQVSP